MSVPLTPSHLVFVIPRTVLEAAMIAISGNDFMGSLVGMATTRVERFGGLSGFTE